MLCKRLSVAMVRNPWQPTPLPLVPTTPTTPIVFIKLLQRNFQSVKAKRGGGGLEKEKCWTWGEWIDEQLLVWSWNPEATGKVSRYRWAPGVSREKAPLDTDYSLTNALDQDCKLAENLANTWIHTIVIKLELCLIYLDTWAQLKFTSQPNQIQADINVGNKTAVSQADYLHRYSGSNWCSQCHLSSKYTDNNLIIYL